MIELGLSNRPKAPVKRGSPERGLHMTVAAFFRRAMPREILWTHFPAGEKREQVTKVKRDGTVVRYSPDAQKLKAMGLQPGWSDFLIVLPGGRLGLIELKSEHGALSPDQRDFRKAALALGALFAECRSIEDVEEIVAHWLAPFGLTLRARLSA